MNTAHRPNRRPLRRITPPVLVALLSTTAVLAEPMVTRNQNSYLMPGLIDMPTAEVHEDGSIGAGYSGHDAGKRYGFSFQATPRLTFGLRYGEFPTYYIDGINEGESLFDRSFDLHYQLWDESGWRPAVAIGLRDFVGTGVYASEYVVATKTLRPGLRATAGLGWGRLATSGSIGAPFGTRDPVDYGNGGSLQPDQWFRGEAAPFGGVAWDYNDKITLKAEYSSDSYQEEIRRNGFERKSDFNFGVDYRLGPFTTASAYLLHGSTVGLQFSMLLNPNKSPFPSSLDKAPAPVRPRPARAADPEGWAGHWSADPTAQPAIQTALADAMAKEGQLLETMSLSATRAELRVRNDLYLAEAQALGRTARLMSRALPPSVEEFVITRTERGMPVASTVIRRSDLERFENDRAADILPGIAIVEPGSAAGQIATPGASPRLKWSLSPYIALSYFDPDEPVRFDVGASLKASYEITPNIILSGELRQRVTGNLKDSRPADASATNNGYPIVRSDGGNYNANGDLFVPRLTATWYARPMPAVYTRVTAGLLEPAFGGVSAEVLWKPVDSRLSLGAEINQVRKRGYDRRFSFQDYETTSGHVSAYYDFGKGYLGQLDVGRYLAGDWGATVSLDREFANGWRVGAYVTKTDMSAEDFGEGSFDKGVRVTIPFSWATGKSSTSLRSGTISSLSRDGGAKLRVEGRLYETVRKGQTGKIYESWGRFWR